MAKENNTVKAMGETINNKTRATIEGYERIIDLLRNERRNLEDQVNRDYYEARRYVRSNPEEGVLFSLLGGLALGYILGKIGRKDR